MPRGRGPSLEQRLADARQKLDAAEQELTDLDAAEQIADRRYDVADEAVRAAWDVLQAAELDREDARADRAEIGGAGASRDSGRNGSGGASPTSTAAPGDHPWQFT